MLRTPVQRPRPTGCAVSSCSRRRYVSRSCAVRTVRLTIFLRLHCSACSKPTARRESRGPPGTPGTPTMLVAGDQGEQTEQAEECPEGEPAGVRTRVPRLGGHDDSPHRDAEEQKQPSYQWFPNRPERAAAAISSANCSLKVCVRPRSATPVCGSGTGVCPRRTRRRSLAEEEEPRPPRRAACGRTAVSDRLATGRAAPRERLPQRGR